MYAACKHPASFQEPVNCSQLNACLVCLPCLRSPVSDPACPRQCSEKRTFLLQTHPYIKILIKVVIGAIGVTLAFQSQLYARWLQAVGAAFAAVGVAAYGISRNNLDASGQLCGPQASEGKLNKCCVTV